MIITSTNPATGKRGKSFSLLSPAELDLKLSNAKDAFEDYRHTSIAERASMMRRAADILDREKESLGGLMTAEMGKTFRAATEECTKSAWVCRYSADS